ncbi:hypothetical protein C3L33_01358, partial [Rhododendron williamsianum]
MALHAFSLCFSGVPSNNWPSSSSSSSSSCSPIFRRCLVNVSAFSSPPPTAHARCQLKDANDFVPTTSGLSLAEAPAFKKAPGGAPANVAVGIARLGGSSAFIGKVGEDEFGYMLAEILKENKVNSEGMRFDPGARTALAFVTLRSDGEREFMFYRNPSADMLLQESELDYDLIRKAKIFHYGSISLITEPCKSAHIAAAKAAKDAGVILSYDPNLRLPLWESEESAREGILSIWEMADIIKVSEEEVSFLTKGDDPSYDVVVRKLFHPKLKLLVVTQGAEGCRYFTKKFTGRVTGLKVDTVDTTGAGDAFVAGVLAQLAEDDTWLEQESICWSLSHFILPNITGKSGYLSGEKRLRGALWFANGCGALTVRERGAIPALPTKEDVFAAILGSGNTHNQTMAEDTQQDKAERERIFRRFDADKDGKISSTELGDALKALGSVTADEVKRMMLEIDTDGDGFISFEEFISFALANKGLMKDVAKIF